MRNRFKYIFSFFLILSFFGFDGNIFIICVNVKNIKETEWVAKANSNTDVSKCYHYNQCTHLVSTNLNLNSWSNEFITYYNRIVSVKLLLQAKIFSIVNIINLISNKLNIPRRSIGYHSISNTMTDLSRQYCLSCLIWHDEGNIMWNYLLRIKWINQQIESSVLST